MAFQPPSPGTDKFCTTCKLKFPSTKFEHCPYCGKQLTTDRALDLSGVILLAPAQVRTQILEELRPLLSEQLGINPELVTERASFQEDFHADSLTLVELLMAIEERFNLPDIQDQVADSIKTVGDLVNYLALVRQDTSEYTEAPV